MACSCSKLPECIYLDDVGKVFLDVLKVVDSAEWVSLMKCNSCGQLWRIDQWDRLQTQFGIKIIDRKNWKNVDVHTLQKKLLLKSRGGIEEEQKCIWAECNLPRVKGVVYCIDHLYETGARK